VSFTVATTAAAAIRPMVGHAVVCACAKRNERIGQPDIGPGGSPQE